MTISASRTLSVCPPPALFSSRVEPERVSVSSFKIHLQIPKPELLNMAEPQVHASDSRPCFCTWMSCPNVSLNDNENTTCQNVWDASEVLLRGKSYLQMLLFGKRTGQNGNNLSVCIRELVSQQQIKPKES